MRRWLLALVLTAFFAGFMLRCEPHEMALLGPCPDADATYELAFLDALGPTFVWSGQVRERECRLVPRQFERTLAARCISGGHASDWTPAVRRDFSPMAECGGR